MSISTPLLLAGLGVLLTMTPTPKLKAATLYNKTTVTFSGPVEIGTKMMPAGTYVFKTLPDNREIVEVTNSREDHVVGLFMTNSIIDPVTPEHAQIRMTEGPKDAPPEVHAWFYPGATIGWEFQQSQAAK